MCKNCLEVIPIYSRFNIASRVLWVTLFISRNGYIWSSSLVLVKLYV